MTSHYIWVWVVQHYFAKDSIILGGCTYYPSKHIKGRPLCQVSEDLEWFAFDCPLWLYIYIYILVSLFRFHTGKPLGHGQSIEKGGQTLMFFPKSAVNRKLLQLSLPLYLIQTGIVAGSKKHQQLQHDFWSKLVSHPTTQINIFHRQAGTWLDTER